MIDEILSSKIYQMALHCGYDNCGILPLSQINMKEYQQHLAERIRQFPQSAAIYHKMESFSQLTTQYPWAKSAIVCITWLGKYRYPKSLQRKYAKAYMLSSHTVPHSKEHQQKLFFEQWLTEQGIQFDGVSRSAPGYLFPLRHVAVLTGLGIFRKNNFFYGENGSYYELEGYLIDKECRYQHTCTIQPCADNCSLCYKACKTHSLSAPYTMEPTLCISFLTTFGQGKIPSSIQEEQLATWICGCDDCQDACPYNKHDWSQGESFYGLDEIEPLLKPENILKATDSILCEKVIPKTNKHIPEDQVETLRISAKRALRHWEMKNK